MPSERCSTYTVDDVPAREDAFGSHAPIATAIHELTTNESGGRTIGLEGTWGSGKSTVVGLLDDRMDGPDDHLVVFDAWAHEDDPLRRSFLETLIESLSRIDWINDQRWSEKREELARRSRVEHTRPVSRIESPAIIAGAAAALLAILVPLGAALVDAGVAANRSLALWSGLICYGALVGLVVGGTVWLLRRRSGPEGGAFLSLFSVESVTASTRTTIETPDPTSIEFESIFRDLMSEALGGDQKRLLVLVVDNLDRVSPDDARSIWATLQTFLHHPHDDCKDWIESLWVLLPYDRAGIARIWGRVPAETNGKTQLRATLAESFIDKSIQVRFEVPLPLLSDWRTYLESNLHSALPDCSEADSYTAYRMYARELATAGRAPSPREVKQYVNRIGALHRRWQHELPFVSLAYYASLSADGMEVADRLGRGQIPGPLLEGLLPEDVDGHLAAIAFNTDPPRALQLLHGPLIEHALSIETSNELLELLDRPGFWEALPQSSTLLMGMGTTALLNAAHRLLDIPYERRPDGEWREVTSLLARQGLAVEDWPPFTRESSVALSGLLLAVDRQIAARIATKATAAAIPADGGAAWAEGAHALLGRFDWLTLLVSGAPEAVCEVLTHFATLDGWRESAPRLTIEPRAREELNEVIVERIAETPVDACLALAVLRRVEPGAEWSPFVEAATNRLRNGAPSQGAEPQPTAEESRYLLTILEGGPQGSSQVRDALVNEGVALEYVWLADQGGDTVALGDWLYEELREFSPESSATRSYPGYAASGKNLLDTLLENPPPQPTASLAQAIERRRDFDVIASIGAYAESEMLASALVVELWESDHFLAALNGRRLRRLWPHIARAGKSDGLDVEELMRLVCVRETLVAEIRAEPFSERLMGMYASVLAACSDGEQNPILAGWVAESLTNLTLTQWGATMADSVEWLALLGAVRNAAPDARIGGAYAQGLARFLEGIAEGREDGTAAAKQWEHAVVPLIAPSVKEAYAEGVARAAAMGGGELPGAFFALVGDTLMEPRILSRSEILAGLLPNLVTEQNIAGLSWLIDALNSKDVRERIPADGFSALAEVVRISLASDPVNVPLRQIADLIGLEVPPEPRRDEQGSQ